MDQDQQALLSQLFAEITTRLEAAHTLAADGQDPRLRHARSRAVSDQLHAKLAEATCLAAAARVLVDSGATPRRVRAPSTRARRRRTREG